MRNNIRNIGKANSAVACHETSHSSSHAADHLGHRLFPLSIRTSFVVILLVPLLIVMGVSSTVVARQLSTRRQAESASQSSLTLDALLRARVDLYDEYIPSQAIVVARSYQVTPAALNSLLGVNVEAELLAARRAVDRQLPFVAGRRSIPNTPNSLDFAMPSTTPPHRPARSPPCSIASDQISRVSGRTPSTICRMPTNRRTLRPRNPGSPPSTPLLTPSLPGSAKRISKAEALSKRCSQPRRRPPKFRVSS